MGKKIVKLIFLILVFIGIGSGIFITLKRSNAEKVDKKKIEEMFESVQTKPITVTNFYTYGDTLNIEGELSNIAKDNFEGAKIILTDGKEEKSVSLDTVIEDKKLKFKTSKINDSIELDKLDLGSYYILFRLKLNNSSVPKMYFLYAPKELLEIEYYTVTKNGENKKVNIGMIERQEKDKTYNYLAVKVVGNNLPDDVYDFVIDAGHGGKDVGERSGTHTEADIALDYAKALKEKLEELGLKVKLTRDDVTSSSFNYVNMYDADGRIGVAGSSRAKYMISFHVNNGNSNLNGLEVYAPTRSNLTFAKLMADKIVQTGAISYSNNTGFRQKEGVYVWNFTPSVIKQFAKTAESKGYEPYNITEDTPYQYTIRETGGIATNAYADGRNKNYSKNQYYDSRQGIETYQVELGYIKNDLDKILNNKDSYVLGIVEAIKEYLEL